MWGYSGGMRDGCMGLKDPLKRASHLFKNVKVNGSN